MLIQVIYANKKPGLVQQTELDKLLATRSLAAFRRADSWAIIGRDPIREVARLYPGQERRGHGEELTGVQADTIPANQGMFRSSVHR